MLIKKNFFFFFVSKNMKLQLEKNKFLFPKTQVNEARNLSYNLNSVVTCHDNNGIPNNNNNNNTFTLEYRAIKCAK